LAVPSRYLKDRGNFNHKNLSCLPFAVVNTKNTSTCLIKSAEIYMAKLCNKVQATWSSKKTKEMGEGESREMEKTSVDHLSQEAVKKINGWSMQLGHVWDRGCCVRMPPLPGIPVHCGPLPWNPRRLTTFGCYCEGRIGADPPAQILWM
jgi:hypothetical protein